MFVFLLLDRNNSNWLVKCETKENNERDMVGGETVVIDVHTLDTFEDSRSSRSLSFFSLASAPPFAFQSTTTSRARTGNRVNKFYICTRIYFERANHHLSLLTLAFCLQIEGNGEGDHLNNATTTDTTTNGKPTVNVRIAAIDNGLAFPFKHPDEWRTYPFHWAWLPQAKIPFSEDIKSLVLPLISDMNFVQHEICDEIQRLFSQDKNYERRLVERQLSVMRGQVR